MLSDMCISLRKLFLHPQRRHPLLRLRVLRRPIRRSNRCSRPAAESFSPSKLPSRRQILILRRPSRSRWPHTSNTSRDMLPLPRRRSSNTNNNRDSTMRPVTSNSNIPNSCNSSNGGTALPNLPSSTGTNLMKCIGEFIPIPLLTLPLVPNLLLSLNFSLLRRSWKKRTRSPTTANIAPLRRARETCSSPITTVITWKPSTGTD